MYKVCKIIDEKTKQQVGHDEIVVIESRYEKTERMLKVHGLLLLTKEQYEKMKGNKQ